MTRQFPSRFGLREVCPIVGKRHDLFGSNDTMLRRIAVVGQQHAIACWRGRFSLNLG